MRRALSWGRLGVFALGAAVLAGACHTATEITLHVTTDAVCDASEMGDVFDTLGIAVGGPGLAKSVSSVQSKACKKLDQDIGKGYGPNDLGTLVLVPAATKTALVEVVVVANVKTVGGDSLTFDECATWVDTGKVIGKHRNYTDPDDGTPLMPCLLARRQLSFVEWSKLDLPIQLDTQCTGVFCQPGSTCVNKTCVTDAPPPSRCKESDPNCNLGGAGGKMMATASVTSGPTATASTNSSSVASTSISSSSVSSSSASSSSHSSSSASTSVSSSSASASSGSGCSCTISNCSTGDICQATNACACGCDFNLCSACNGTCQAVAVAPQNPGMTTSHCVCGSAATSSSASSSASSSSSISSSSASSSAMSSSSTGPFGSSGSGGCCGPPTPLCIQPGETCNPGICGCSCDPQSCMTACAPQGKQGKCTGTIPSSCTCI